MNLLSTHGCISQTNQSGLNYNVTKRELASNVLSRNYPDGLLNFAAICCMVLMCIGILGNLVTIIALARDEKVRNATTILIMNMSCSDLLFCLFNLPMTVSFYYRSWTYGCLLCRIFAYARYGLGGVSLFSILATSINRYIIITHPTPYPTSYRRRNLQLMLALTWIVPFGMLIFTWFEKWGRFGLNVKLGTCDILPDVYGRSPKRFLLPISISLALIASIICYVRIYYKVKKATRASKVIFTKKHTTTSNYENNLQIDLNKPASSLATPGMPRALVKPSFPNRKDKRLGTMIMAIIICFCITHLPIMIPKMLPNYISYRVANLVGYILICMSACINPVIYVVMSNKYRQAYKRLFQCQA